MAQDAPVLKIEVRTIGSKAPMGPWKGPPGSVWIREQLTTAEETEKARLPGRAC
jgi:hypothetical protein